MKNTRFIRKTLFFIVTCLCIFGMAGCSLLDNLNKDEVLDRYNNMIQSVGSKALTKDRALKGERSFGTDQYVGTYTAEYKNFSKKEVLFGGTSIERDTGKTAKVTCKLDITEGTAQLFYISGSNEPEILMEASGEYSETIELKDGGSYFGISGEDFTGSVDLTIEDIRK